MKKSLKAFALLLVLAVVSAIVDVLLGIKMQEVGLLISVVHKTMYMGIGAIIATKFG